MYFDDIKVTKLLMKEIEEYKKGKRKSPSNELTQYYLDVVNNILKSSKYAFYTDDWKEEFLSYASYKFVKYWHTFKINKSKSNFKNGKLKTENLKGAYNFFTSLAISAIHYVIRNFNNERKNKEELANEYNNFWHQEWYLKNKL